MKKALLPLAVSALVFLLGCAHAVSKEARETVNAQIAVEDLFADPDAYRGTRVMLGGVIVSSMNAEEGTYIEAVERPLDYRGRPRDTDLSRGRFIVLTEGYLDTAIFSKGREITVVGDVQGESLRPLGETQYPYLMIKSVEVHLFKPRRYGYPVHFGIGIFGAF